MHGWGLRSVFGGSRGLCVVETDSWGSKHMLGGSGWSKMCAVGLKHMAGGLNHVAGG